LWYRVYGAGEEEGREKGKEHELLGCEYHRACAVEAQMKPVFGMRLDST
jgi:hypothetical protein